MKECSKCKEKKNFTEFYRRKERNGYKSHCKSCESEHKKEYYKKNKAHIRSRNDQWKKDNPDKHNKNFRKWRINNLDIMNAHCSAARAKRIKRYVDWADSQYIKDLYRNAKEASKIFGIDYEVDHVIPLQGKYVSGLHVEDNLQILPSFENRTKSNKWLITI